MKLYILEYRLEHIEGFSGLCRFGDALLVIKKLKTPALKETREIT